MAKSVLARMSADDLWKIKSSVVYDPTAPNGLRWVGKRKGRRVGVGKTFWIDQVSFKASNVVMILNDKWPGDNNSVVTRINKSGLWGDVENLKWLSREEALTEGHEHNRQELLRNLFGENVPELGNKLRLSKLCRRSHEWNGYPVTLQYKQGSEWRCKECDKLQNNSPASRAWREANKEKQSQYGKASHERRMAEDLEGELRRIREKHQKRVESGKIREYKAKLRESLRAQGLTSRGTEPKVKRDETIKALQKSLRPGRRSPTVPQLVMQAQRLHWQENPEEKRRHTRQWNSYTYSWRYKCDPSFRRHECQRNSEKKARNRNNHTVKLCRSDIDARFAEFNNQCAFCGSGDQLIIEHFIPRSKGGPHAIGNILPACHKRCNMSKFNHDPEEWYRSRSYFSETRWRKILRVLGKAKAGIHQLPLL